jgi:membrane protease YdiL (CAAX protease family)
MQHRPLTVQRRAPGGYLALAQRPLHILAFLLPLIILYEVGASRYLSDPAHGTAENIRAHSMLLGFFQDFGLAGRFLPAIALITVLLLSHTLHKDRWRLNPGVLVLMVVESIVWTVPLVVIVVLVGWVLGQPVPVEAAAPGVLPPQLAGPIAELMLRSKEARITVAIGAGLYEELVFRMIGMAALHLVFVDLARLSETTGRWLAVLISAAAFAAYHDQAWQSGVVNLAHAVPFFVAGAYFGLIFLHRGFGIVVAVHALYDVVALLDPFGPSA